MAYIQQAWGPLQKVRPVGPCARGLAHRLLTTPFTTERRRRFPQPDSDIDHKITIDYKDLVEHYRPVAEVLREDPMNTIAALGVAAHEVRQEPERPPIDLAAKLTPKPPVFFPAAPRRPP